MKTVTVRRTYGPDFEAPSIGKVLKKDYSLTSEQRDDLMSANISLVEQKVGVGVGIKETQETEAKIQAASEENKEYYATLPKYFNYNPSGEKVNSYKNRREYQSNRKSKTK